MGNQPPQSNSRPIQLVAPQTENPYYAICKKCHTKISTQEDPACLPPNDQQLCTECAQHLPKPCPTKPCTQIRTQVQACELQKKVEALPVANSTQQLHQAIDNLPVSRETTKQKCEQCVRRVLLPNRRSGKKNCGTKDDKKLCQQCRQGLIKDCTQPACKEIDAWCRD